jgi:hypothetical protein
MYSENDPARAGGCPIRTSLDHSLLAAPQGFSQRATSFIASWRQGIHQMPFSRSPQPFRRRTPRTAPTRATVEPHRTHPMRTPCRKPPNLQARPASLSTRISTPMDNSHRRHPRAGALAPALAHTLTLLTRANPAPPRKMAVRPSRAARPTSAPTPIHSTKDHTQRPATPLPRRVAGIPNPAAAHPTPLETAPLETTGLEPVTPCLQSRCSPR